MTSPQYRAVMTKSITANRPARTQRLSNGKSVSYPAYSTTFTQDAAGQWSTDGFKVFERDVIEACAKATNWAEIRREHFPMAGFHS